MNSMFFVRQRLGRKTLEILSKSFKPFVRSYSSPPQTEIYQAAILHKFKNHLQIEKLARSSLSDGEVSRSIHTVSQPIFIFEHFFIDSDWCACKWCKQDWYSMHSRPWNNIFTICTWIWICWWSFGSGKKM